MSATTGSTFSEQTDYCLPTVIVPTTMITIKINLTKQNTNMLLVNYNLLRYGTHPYETLSLEKNAHYNLQAKY